MNASTKFPLLVLAGGVLVLAGSFFALGGYANVAVVAGILVLAFALWPRIKAALAARNAKK